ncbi:hypothetical protein BsWGS_23602 [Bradybaena similaris]
MRLVAVAAVLVVLLACLAGLESAPSARAEADVSEDVVKQVKRDLEAFERALFADEDQTVRNKRGWLKKVWRKVRPVLVNVGVQYAAKAVLGKRDHEGFSE